MSLRKNNLITLFAELPSGCGSPQGYEVEGARLS